MNSQLLDEAIRKARYARDLPNMPNAQTEMLTKRLDELEARIATLEGPREPTAHINSERIINAVCAAYGLVRLELINQFGMGATRPRMIAAYLMHKYTALSWNQIGRRLGGRDHSTIVHSFKKITVLRETDQVLNAKISNIEAALHA